MKNKKPNAESAKKHLAALRKLVAQRKHPFFDMTEEEVIEALRKTREEVWKEKVAARS